MIISKEIIQQVQMIAWKGQHVEGREIFDLAINSSKVIEDSAFIAQKGDTTDGHLFINQSIENGARVIICEHFPETIQSTISYLKVKDVRLAIAVLANHLFDFPSKKINLIGITGTNGKTTIATILYHLFKNLGYKTGLLSTIENRIDEKIVASHLTTPDCISINRMLSEMVEKDITHVFMECSSHAIEQKRIYGLQFTGGIFSNLTHDHLDYHKKFSIYRDVKKSFFDDYLSSTSFAITNLDDKNGTYMIQNTKAKCYTYSAQKIANYSFKIISSSLQGLEIEINQKRFSSPLIGEYNAYNLAGVFGCAIQLGIDPNAILTNISAITGITGRMQIVSKNKKGIVGIVDYAHTPDALQNSLKSLKKLKMPQQNIIVIIGCGGDRDKSKRGSMGKIACMLADKVILTSDNPRSEDPLEICKQMMSNLNPEDIKKVTIDTNRKKAIQIAIELAQKNDIILIAGKGHEEYQIIGNQKLIFSDKEVFQNLTAK